eukprot:SAG11_NODE_5272_length_1609_cov_2.502649_1_plen_294_part_10
MSESVVILPPPVILHQSPRPDGSLRSPRKVRPGWVPLEERSNDPAKLLVELTQQQHSLAAEALHAFVESSSSLGRKAAANAPARTRLGLPMPARSRPKPEGEDCVDTPRAHAVSAILDTALLPATLSATAPASLHGRAEELTARQRRNRRDRPRFSFKKHDEALDQRMLVAAADGNLTELQRLHGEGGRLDCRRDRTWTLAQCAAAQGRGPTLRWLLDAGAPTAATAGPGPGHRRDLLQTAAEFRHAGCARVVLEAGLCYGSLDAILGAKPGPIADVRRVLAEFRAEAGRTAAY